MRHPDDPAYVVGVVGCGAMGQGIAQVSVQGGMRTILYDAREGGAAAARERIGGHIDRMAERGRVSAGEAGTAKSRLEVADGQAPAVAALLRGLGFEGVGVTDDLAGRARVVEGRR